MKIQNADIYHCQQCGRVVHQDPGQPEPTCCGEVMAKAASRTVNVVPEEHDPPPSTEPEPAP